MRITFHMGKYTVTVVIRKPKRRIAPKKTTATLASDGSFVIL